MEIIKTNVAADNKKAIYKLTKASGISVQDAAENLSIPVNTFALYNEPKEQRDGTLKDNIVLSFTSTDGSKYSTISNTFIREFFDIIDIMAGDSFAIIIKKGTTKGGKSFVTCELDCDF